MKIEIEWYKKKDALGLWCYELRTAKGTVLYRVEADTLKDGWEIVGQSEAHIERLWRYTQAAHAKRAVENFLGVQK